MPSAWATAPAAGAAALGRHLAGGRCRLARTLSLQERSPLQAAALAAGLPLTASQQAATPCGLAVGAAYTHRHCPCRCQPCPRAAAPARGFGCGRSPPCRGGLGHSRLPLAADLALASLPCRAPGRGRPPSFLAAFTAKTGREENRRWWLKLQLSTMSLPSYL
ncbi:hypothetical protein BHM03_00052526 [Ensete ventricosum]|nr:hypothetical protein BHM03_00052526 [Ensete ventricosum]